MMNRIQAAIRSKRTPFYMSGKFFDWQTGLEYFNTKHFAGPYEGECFVGRDLFRTWIDNGERAWTCLEIAR